MAQASNFPLNPYGFYIGADGKTYSAGTSGPASNVTGQGFLDTVNMMTGSSAGGPGMKSYAIPQDSARAASVVAPANDGTPLPTGTGTGSDFTDTSAARNQTMGSINALDQILANKLAEAQAQYEQVIKGYNEQDANNLQEYNDNVSTNENNRESQHQAALLAAAQGSRGLYAALASIGALSGTGKLLANRAVANEANTDIGNADKAFGDNATTLTSTYKKLEQQERDRRNKADTNLRATRQSRQLDIAQQRQNLWKDMAKFWELSGNKVESNNALAKAGSFTNDIVANSQPQVSEYAPADLQFSAPALKSYLAGANDMTVKAASNPAGLPINGAIFTSTKKRDQALV